MDETRTTDVDTDYDREREEALREALYIEAEREELDAAELDETDDVPF